MVQIIAGKKGKGKTKYLLAGANEAVENAKGSIVYIDKNGKHMYELSNKVRLINVAEFPIRSYNAFVGFICGIVSQDHDIEAIFLDSFLTVAHLEDVEDLTQAIDDFDKSRRLIMFVLYLVFPEILRPCRRMLLTRSW